MLIRDLKHKIGRTHRIHPAEVRLPVRLGHRDAETLFLEPLKTQLAVAGLGTVLSCELRKRASGDVIGVNLFLGLTKPGKDTLETVARMLEALSAPCGSSIRLSDATGMPLMFGQAEGLELSIDSTGGPDAAAQRAFAMTCRETAEKVGVNRGWSDRGGQTRFFFYSENLPAMRKGLARILEDHPEFSGAALRRLA